MKTLLVLAGCMSVFWTGICGAAPPRSGPAPGTTQHPTAGTHHKASSFAPHPTKRRVFGAPIQGPIMKHAPPKQKPAPK